MSDSGPTVELGLLRWEVARIESGARTIQRNGVDVTRSELRTLKREIAFLENIRARAEEAQT
jgi:hypothetical protein